MSRTRPPIAGSMRTAIGGSQMRRRREIAVERHARESGWQRPFASLRCSHLFLSLGLLSRTRLDTTWQYLIQTELCWLAPWEPIALDELAQRQLTNNSGELSSVEDLARRALLSDPLDSRALSLLGLVAERKGDLARAEALMSLVGGPELEKS